MGCAAAGVTEDDVIDTDTLYVVCRDGYLDDLATFVYDVAEGSAVGNSEPPSAVLFGEERFIHTCEAGIEAWEVIRSRKRTGIDYIALVVTRHNEQHAAVSAFEEGEGHLQARPSCLRARYR